MATSKKATGETSPRVKLIEGDDGRLYFVQRVESLRMLMDDGTVYEVELAGPVNADVRALLVEHHARTHGDGHRITGTAHVAMLGYTLPLGAT